VHLAVYPDPKGDKLAIVLDPPDQADSNAAMVIIDRRGQILDATDDLKGPSGYTPPAWSPDGRSLAYPTFTGDGPALALWPLGHPIIIRPAPNRFDRLSSCQWNPTGSALLCATGAASYTDNPRWLLANSNGFFLATPDTDTPLVWLGRDPQR
jgi:hypothetical protein